MIDDRADYSRAISTVTDVTLALLLISASVATFALYLNDPEPAPSDPEKTTETAQTLSSTTMTAEYELSREISYPRADGSRWSFDITATRETHGTVTQLMADAATSSVRINGRSPAVAPGKYSKAIEASLLSIITGLDVEAQVVAIWRPYPGSGLKSRVAVGPSPPRDADVSLARITVPSGLEPVDDEEVERAYRRDGYEGAADVVAGAMVEGYFPPEETQVALEGGDVTRDLTVYRYVKLGGAVGVAGLPSKPDEITTGSMYALGPERPLLTYGANATEANRQLSEALARNVIEDDLRSAAGGWTSSDAETVAAKVSVGEVVIVVRTWN